MRVVVSRAVVALPSMLSRQAPALSSTPALIRDFRSVMISTVIEDEEIPWGKVEEHPSARGHCHAALQPETKA